MKERWDYKEIGEVCEVTDYVANGSFATLRMNVQYKSEPDYAILIRLADYTNNFDSSKFVYINEHAYNFLAKSKLYGGEIIMSNVGSLGKEFICPKLDRPMSLAPNSIVIRTPFNKFFYYCFNSTSLQEKIKSISSQTALPKFNKTQFKKLVIPIPSPSEQQHIVEELDLLSSIIEKKKTQLNELDNLAQSLFYEMFGDPITNDKGWEVKQIGDICNPVKNIKWNAFSEEDTFTYIDLSAVDRSDRCIKDTIFICKNDAPSRAKQIVKTGDVLFGTTRPTLKRVCTINKEFDGSICSTGFCVIRPKQEIIKSHIVYYNLLTNSFYAYIEPLQSGASYPAVTDKIVKSFTIPIPPIELQQEFASKIEFIERQKEVINKSINEVETLFNSRMDYYFN